jgi:hypothetical protein
LLHRRSGVHLADEQRLVRLLLRALIGGRASQPFGGREQETKK